MSVDRSSEHRSWLERITQAFVHEPRNREELLEVLQDAHENHLLDRQALSIVEGAIQVADLQARDIMVPRSQMVTIRADQTPREFLPMIIEPRTPGTRSSARAPTTCLASCWPRTWCR